MTPEQLKELRTKYGLSQENLAELLGYKDKSSISRLESGERSINPRQELLIRQALNEEK